MKRTLFNCTAPPLTPTTTTPFPLHSETTTPEVPTDEEQATEIPDICVNKCDCDCGDAIDDAQGEESSTVYPALLIPTIGTFCKFHQEYLTVRIFSQA